MNSFNNITRFKYLENKESVVSLDEYILLADERKKEKYAIFKLQNNLNQTLYGIKFEITQYNEDGNILQKNVISYNQFAIHKNSSFIPEAKLPVMPSCVKISFELLYAHFTTTIWENGSFKPISIKFDDYKKDIPQTKTKKELKKELKKAKINKKIFEIEEKNAENTRRKLEKDLYSLSDGKPIEINGRNAFKLKDLSKKQKPVFAKFLSVVMSFALVVFIAFSVITYSFMPFSYYNDLVSVGDYDFNFEDGEVVGYYGNNNNPVLQGSYSFEFNYTINQYLVYGLNYAGFIATINDKPELPDKISRTFNVVSVGKKAFKGSNINSITLPNTLTTFEDEAFKNCKSLNSIKFIDSENLHVLGNDCLRNTDFKTITLNSVLQVEQGALADCGKLEAVVLTNAQVEKNAFEGSTNLKYLDIGNTKVSKLADLFGGEIPENLTFLNLTNMIEADLPGDFLLGCNDNIRVFANGREILNYRRLF